MKAGDDQNAGATSFWLSPKSLCAQRGGRGWAPTRCAGARARRQPWSGRADARPWRRRPPNDPAPRRTRELRGAREATARDRPKPAPVNRAGARGDPEHDPQGGDPLGARRAPDSALSTKSLSSVRAARGGHADNQPERARAM